MANPPRGTVLSYDPSEVVYNIQREQLVRLRDHAVIDEETTWAIDSKTGRLIDPDSGHLYHAPTDRWFSAIDGSPMDHAVCLVPGIGFHHQDVTLSTIRQEAIDPAPTPTKLDNNRDEEESEPEEEPEQGEESEQEEEAEQGEEPEQGEESEQGEDDE